MKKFYVFGRIEAGDGFGFDDFKTINHIFNLFSRQMQKNRRESFFRRSANFLFNFEIII